MSSMRFLILALLLSASSLLYAQDTMDKDEGVAALKVLLKKMNTREITGKTLNNNMSFLMNELQNNAIYFDRDEIEDLLEPYKTYLIKNKDTIALINYYINLSNNALFSNRFGESNYYLGKAENEAEKFNKGKPLLVFYNRLNLYVVQQNYDKIIALYKENEDYLMSFTKLLKEEKLGLNIAQTFNAMIEPVVEAYAVHGNEDEANKLMDQGSQILDYFTVMKEKDPKPGFVNAYFTQKFHYIKMQFHKALHLDKNPVAAGKFLDSLVLLIKNTDVNGEVLDSHYDNAVFESKVLYFLKINHPDSAKFYISKIEEDPMIEPMNYYKTKQWLAEAEATEGNYKNAYQTLKSSVYVIDSINNTVLNEMDNLLYAHLKAEEKQKELVQTEKEKHRRTLVFVIIIAVLLSVSGLVFYVMRRKYREAGKVIDDLNQAANFQVTLMEEMKNRAVSEEKKRMGRELHDGLSSDISAIMYQAELLKMDSSPENAKKLEQIINRIQDVHKEVRNTSHSWYESSEKMQEMLYHTQVNTLVHTILPVEKFKVTIDIDETSLQYTNADIRIEFIRIIQEAITNILKHSNATAVNILQYYDQDRLHLCISDNGTGIKKKINMKNSLGLRSINDRVQNLKGSFEIYNNKTGGTELSVSVPAQ